MKVDTRACIDSCVLKTGEMKVVCGKEIGGNWTYNISMMVFNPFAMNANITIAPIAAGTFGPITPNPVVPGSNMISFVFTDVSPANSIICFKVMMTEVETDKSCWKTVCLDLPKCGILVSTLENSAESFRMSVNPNPAVDETTINYSIANYEGTLNFEIFDVYGKRVYSVQKKTDETQENINTSGLAGGVYYIRVSKQGEQLGTAKLMIIK